MVLALGPCLLLAPQFAAAADLGVVADFDGDGLRDRVTLDRNEPSQLIVWLSATQDASIIRSRAPVLLVVATDLDGDSRAELITRGSSGLEVWTRPHRRFRTFRAQRDAPAELRRDARGSLDDPPSRAVAAAPIGNIAVVGLALSPAARAPDRRATGLHSRVFIPGVQCAASAPFSPRPPPASLA